MTSGDCGNQSDLRPVLLDFGAWLAEEVTGKPMTPADLESCLDDWRQGLPRSYGDPTESTPADRPIRERLILAAVDALRPGDPRLVIGVGEDEVKLGWWVGGYANRTPRGYETHTVENRESAVPETTSWKVIIDGEIEDVYLSDDEIHVSGTCSLSASEAVRFAEVLVRAAAVLSDETGESGMPETESDACAQNPTSDTEPADVTVSSHLRDRLIKAVTDARPVSKTFTASDGYLSVRIRSDEEAAAVAVDAVIAALGPIPAPSFTDDHGRTWEWCGGKPGTWTWRITALPISRKEV